MGPSAASNLKSRLGKAPAQPNEILESVGFHLVQDNRYVYPNS